MAIRLFNRKRKTRDIPLIISPQQQPDVVNKDYQTGSGIAGTTTYIPPPEQTPSSSSISRGEDSYTFDVGNTPYGTAGENTVITGTAAGSGFEGIFPSSASGGGGGSLPQSTLTTSTESAKPSYGSTSSTTPSGFTGQVEVFGTTGEQEQTLFYKNNKQVARFYKEEKGGETYAELGKGYKEAKFTFPMSDVTFNLEGAQISEYEYITGTTPPSDAQPFSTISAVKQKKGIGGFFQNLESERAGLSTQLARGENVGILQRGELLGLTFGRTIVRGGVGLFQLGKGLVTQPVETIKMIPSGAKTYVGELGTTLRTGSPEEVLGTVGGEIAFFKGFNYAPKVSEFIRASNPLLRGKIPFKETPTIEMQNLVQPFTRQRATVLLQTEGGKYVLGRTASGETISFGGLIEKGESSYKAGLRELREETGIRKQDISNYRFAGKIVTPEETFLTYTGTLKKGTKIIPSSDISNIVYLNPSRARNILGQEITGQSFIYPITRRGVRGYELGIINYLERGTTPTWLGLKTPKGTYYLGTQSRYNVAGFIQKKYLKQDNLLLAHGTENPLVFRRNPFIDVKGKINPLKHQRGEVSGLYVQPPISAFKLEPQVFQESFLRKGKNVYLKIRQPRGEGLISNKPGTFVKFTQPQQRGYIGLSYLGFGKQTSEGLGLKIGFRKRTAIILDEDPLSLISTPKSRKGFESELAIEPNKYLKTVGRAKSQFVGGKKVWIQPAKILESEEISSKISKLDSNIPLSEKKGILKELKIKTGVDYSYRVGEYTYVNPIQLSSVIRYSKPKSEELFNFEERNLPKSKTLKRSITNYYGRKETRNYGFRTLKKDYFIYGGGGGNEIIYEYQGSPPIKNPPIKIRNKFPQPSLTNSIDMIRGERLFIPTTSFGTSLGKQIGLKISAVSPTGTLARTGLVERKYRTSQLPTTVLWKVKKGEFNL